MNFPLTIAYNISERKVGCVLVQTLMGSTFIPGDVSLYFETSRWELSVSKCKLFVIRTQEEFNQVIKVTHM